MIESDVGLIVIFFILREIAAHCESSPANHDGGDRRLPCDRDSLTVRGLDDE
jgi:hypothetical protein